MRIYVCEFGGFDSGMVEVSFLLGCDTVPLDDHSPKFRIPHHRNVGNQFSSDEASLLLQKNSVVSTIHSAQTGSGSHTASYWWVTRGFFPGSKSVGE